LRSLVFLPDRIIQLGPSVPTRRSSDLDDGVFHAHFLDCLGNALRLICIVFGGTSRGDSAECAASRTNISQDHKRSRTRSPAFTRSEEHTSELQSRENLVCRLLLEKKKQ